ncbi:MAG: cytochrome oxidase small assembly protein [Betaproteobacteria bacterium]|jgi:flagellar biogenesis protein FliO
MRQKAAVAPTPEQRKANARLGWILASMALVFAVGFVVKIVWLGR